MKLLYGAGMRSIECLRLRVKDVDFEYRQITVRDGKGAKDRVTVLPASLVEPLRSHLERVKALHEGDLRRGLGSTYLPFALARKFPRAGLEWGWQYAASHLFQPATIQPHCAAAATCHALRGESVLEEHLCPSK